MQTLLKEHKCLTNKQIAEKLNVPLTQIEHYFRRDQYFAIPEPSIWFELKELLNISTTEFDEQITEFIVIENQFDMGNRLYDARGISPTLLVDCGNKLILCRNRKRNKQNTC